VAATIDIYAARVNLPAAPTNGTLAVVTGVGREAGLWVFITGTGWLRAAHPAHTQAGE